MKKRISRILGGCVMFAVAVVAIASFASCSKDEPKIPEPQTFHGQLATSIPQMPAFEAVVCDDNVTLTWENAEQTLVNIKLDGFSITVSTPMGEHLYTIGDINIPGVPCRNNGDKIIIPEKEFVCMAGEFEMTGKLNGTLENGRLMLSCNYTLGKMPFGLQSVFTSK